MTKLKPVYSFEEANSKNRMLLGGKGAGLSEMTRLKLPVPPGFTITTQICNQYYENRKKLPKNVIPEVMRNIIKIEKKTGKKWNSANNPLLVSVRSGAAISMPGMMDTILNLGLNDQTVLGLAKKTNNPRFTWDSYRRFIQLFGKVVFGVSDEKFDRVLDPVKKKQGVTDDSQLDVNSLKRIVTDYKKICENHTKRKFPSNPNEQLQLAIEAVFKSWMGERAVVYREKNNITKNIANGTAVNVVTMVFGNMGNDSATGVVFTRNGHDGKKEIEGEYLLNAQGEDVVAGTRTPQPLNEATKTTESTHLESLEDFLPDIYLELNTIRTNLEQHYRDMQDIEFTIEEGKLWMLQTRTGKRTGGAAITIAVDMVKEKLISKKEAIISIIRVSPNQIDELLHPRLDIKEEETAEVVAKGLPAGPGGGVGQVVFTPDDAEAWEKKGKKVILVREETSPEDIHGMHAAEAILTAKGGMTSHAALVARGWGKCCIVGCADLNIDFNSQEMRVNNKVIKKGDWVSMNGSKGVVYLGQVTLQPADPESHDSYKELMSWADNVRILKVRTNADSPEDSKQAIAFGAEGIGLCRTEHMFFDPKRIMAMRKMILAESEHDRRSAVMELLPYQRKDFNGILNTMAGKPVTIRLLDPPLHEFIQLNDVQVKDLANELNVPEQKIRDRIASLHEFNPMLGHRGCRLGVAYPEITEMQARAIFEATADLIAEGIDVMPEVMVPLVGTNTEFEHQEVIIRNIADIVMKEKQISFHYIVGTMIELPRACLTADEIAKNTEFFSFGTNDLTQTTYGFSRDDIGGFLPEYLEQNIFSQDPFQSLDKDGVGQLISMAVTKGRNVRKNLKIGICGEHGGDPASVEFCHQNGLDYVSCSPFRVPIARFAAAQAAIKYRD